MQMQEYFKVTNSILEHRRVIIKNRVYRVCELYWIIALADMWEDTNCEPKYVLDSHNCIFLPVVKHARGRAMVGMSVYVRKKKHLAICGTSLFRKLHSCCCQATNELHKVNNG